MPLSAKQYSNETEAVLSFIEKSGDFINSKAVPTLISADNVYQNLSNYLVLDLRTHGAYVNGHIDGAVNVKLDSLLNYLETKNSASSYEKVILVCYTGQIASYACSMLRFLGYGNAYALKRGMGAWNKATSKHLVNNLSNKYAGTLEKENNKKGNKGKLPVIKTGEKTAYAILHKRVEDLLKQGFKSARIKVDTLFNNLDNYYIVSYWPENVYNLGHIKGSICYKPKSSLSLNADLLSLPTNKPIVIYDYTGQHVAFVTAYLRILGYKAQLLSFGANSFMNGLMLSNKEIGHGFNPATDTKDYPLVTGENPSDKAVSVISENNANKKKKAPVKRKKVAEEEGGC